MKRIIKDYFTFSKKERIAIVLLLVLMVCFITAPWLYHATPRAPVDTKVLDAYIANAAGKTPGDSNINGKDEDLNTASTKNVVHAHPKAESFPFDPNTITEEGWIRLGVNEKTARTINNYRSKGGRFRKPDDIKKIWGIRKEDAERLLPFVRIADKAPPIVAMEKEVPYPKTIIPKKIESIDINTASEEEWKSLPGIGEVLAKRVLKFREHTGGFTSVTQVGQTYGLPDSTFQKIIAYLHTNTQTLPKWNINELSAYDLQRRLFVDASTARSIIYFRKKNGAFQSPDDLRKCGVSDTMFQRIAGFLKVE